MCTTVHDEPEEATLHDRDYYLRGADELLTEVIAEAKRSIRRAGRFVDPDTAPRIDALANAAQAFIAMAAELREGENG